DEADRMLDMGFIDDIQKIITYLPDNHQTLMFSATMAPSIARLAKKILKNPAEISLSISKPAAGVDQKAYLCYDEQKVKVLRHILSERKNYDSIIVFTSTKSKVSDIVQELVKNGFPATGISSNLTQENREEVLRGFRSKRIRILVATDVMSRGIDVKEINMVINFDVPHDAEDYVHRVGRTARVNATGEAFTLVNPKDMFKLKKIEQLIGSSVPKLPPPDFIGQGPSWNDARSESGNKRKFGGNKKPFKRRNPRRNS
ncbi:MAG TPA: ATP-dependent RNA helicase, partial [Flavobacteriales bacterium]|nr:ATP-dependent RNA helicase [Flavobacteriales bacterium]